MRLEQLRWSVVRLAEFLEEILAYTLLVALSVAPFSIFIQCSLYLSFHTEQKIKMSKSKSYVCCCCLTHRTSPCNVSSAVAAFFVCVWSTLTWACRLGAFGPEKGILLRERWWQIQSVVNMSTSLLPPALLEPVTLAATTWRLLKKKLRVKHMLICWHPVLTLSNSPDADSSHRHRDSIMKMFLVADFHLHIVIQTSHCGWFCCVEVV